MPLLDAIPIVGLLEWGNPWMLGWLAAAMIPLALHLLHRRKQQELPWAAMELLLQAIRQNSRTVRIEQWLLLFLRTSACILFAMALARPWMRGAISDSNTAENQPKLWVLVIDASYSMGYAPQRRTHWELAQQRAIEHVNQAASGDAFVLIRLAEPSQAIIAQPTFEAQRVVELIQQMKCSDAGGEMSSCLQAVNQAVDDARQSAPEHDHIQIIFYSDMGRDTWQSVVAGSDRRVFQDLSSRARIQLESFAVESPINVAVTNLETDSPLALRGSPIQLTATIQNFGGTDVKQLPVQFQSDGKTLRTQFVDCPAGQARSVTAVLQPPTTGYWLVAAAIPSDRLTIDDQRRLVVSVRPQIRVVTIEETTNAARLVNLSLVPQVGLATTASRMAVTSWRMSEMASRSFSGVDAIILYEPWELKAESIAKLRMFVEDGGGLLVLPGPRTQPTAWNRPVDSASQLFGFEMRQPSANSDWHIDPMNYTSPIAKPFANFSDAGLLTTPIFKYWQIAQRDASGQIVDLKFNSGDPLIVRRRMGSGWTAALLSAPATGAVTSNATTSASSEDVWNAMSTWPSFVPIMQKLVETIVGGAEQSLNVSVGRPLQGTLSPSARTTDLTVRRPDNTQSRIAIASTNNAAESRIWTMTNTEQAGFYHIAIDADPGRPFAVNIVPNQSDLQFVAPESMPLTDGPEESASQPKSITSQPDGGPSEWISRACLALLLAVLICESVMAWSLGRRLS